MSAYIEERPDAIEAIKKAIDEKWNPICMGCTGNYADEIECALCELYDMECGECSLGHSNNSCARGSLNSYSAWAEFGERPEDAEAMLEALVMLLPPEHRKQYGG